MTGAELQSGTNPASCKPSENRNPLDKQALQQQHKEKFPAKEEIPRTTEESVATQVSAEEEGEMTSHTPEGAQDSATASANPLFKLVNAAASIQKENEVKQQEQEEEEPPKEQQEPKPKEQATKDQDMTDAKTGDSIKGTTATTTPSSSLPATNHQAPVNNSNNIDKSQITTADKRQGTPPPNVLKGTKEDLMLDPKIKISFAEHLYNVLENEEHHDVLQWMPDGNSFTVVNHKKFVLQKMPTLFQIRNMSSFVRKLGRWGFSRVFEKETNNSDVFKHPKFIRGDRSGVRKHVKCLGRAGNPANKQNNAAGAGANPHLPRQPDFVVCQEPGKPPMVVPTRPGANVPSSPGAGMRHPSMMMNHHNMTQAPGFEFRQPRSLSGTGGFPMTSNFMPSSLDEVANASAASAEALYLSHQQQQKAKMEQLAAEQQRLEDMEIERLMKRREMRQQQRFMEQRRMMMDGSNNSASAAPAAAANHNNGAALIGNSSSSSQHMDASMQSQQSLPQPQPQQQQVPPHHHHHHPGAHQYQRMPPHDILHSNTMPQGSNNPAMDLRRVSMQHGTMSLDGSLGRSASSRYSTMSESSPTAQVTPTYDTRKVLSAAYETLQRDEMRSRERQAAIRALLAEEQEFEARRRAAYSGGGGGAGMGQHHAPSAASYMRG